MYRAPPLFANEDQARSFIINVVDQMIKDGYPIEEKTDREDLPEFIKKFSLEPNDFQVETMSRVLIELYHSKGSIIHLMCVWGRDLRWLMPITPKYTSENAR